MLRIVIIADMAGSDGSARTFIGNTLSLGKSSGSHSLGWNWNRVLAVFAIVGTMNSLQAWKAVANIQADKETSSHSVTS